MVKFKLTIIARGVCELVYKLTADCQHISLILLSRLNCNSMKFSREVCHVKTWSFSDVSGNKSVPITPWNGDGDSSRNVGKTSYLDASVYTRKFRWILSPRKIQGLF